MKKTINFSEFVAGFQEIGLEAYFSFEAKLALFDYLEELESESEKEIEFEPVDICKDWTEYKTYLEAAINYAPINYVLTEEKAIKYIAEKTTVLKTKTGIVVKKL